MKKLLPLIFLFYTGVSYAQGTILSFYTLPALPTTNDVVKVVASLSFTSGGCEVSEQGHTTNSLRTDAYAHHCLGMLTVICNTTDTFQLGTLPSGEHTFVLTLTTGGGPAPCTPGIVVDDTDSITFTVDPAVGIFSPDNKFIDFSIYPNPASSEISILPIAIGTAAINPQSTVTIYNSQGQLVYQLTNQPINQLTIDLSQFTSGLYYVHLQSSEGVAVKKFEVIR